jgi:hypothetical protein
VGGNESESYPPPAPAREDDSSRYVRNSAHLPHLHDRRTTKVSDAAPWEGEAGGRGGLESQPAHVFHDEPPAATEPAFVVDVRDHTSRYERRSGALPHLTDDPDWVSPATAMPQPVRDEKSRRFRRLRRPFRRS